MTKGSYRGVASTFIYMAKVYINLTNMTGVFSVLVHLLTLLTISEVNVGWVGHAVMGGSRGHE